MGGELASHPRCCEIGFLMTINPHFVAMLLHGSFASGNHTQQSFSALVLRVGSYLGVIRIHGANFIHKLPSFDEDERLQRVLRLPKKIPLGADSMFIVHDVLKATHTIKGWFSSKSVPLMALAAWDSYSSAEKLSTVVGANKFSQTHATLNLVVDATSRAYICMVENREVNYSTDLQIGAFPDLLEKAWIEFQAINT